MKQVLLLGLLAGSVIGMEANDNPLNNVDSTAVKPIANNQIVIPQPETTRAYIPQHYDHTDEFHSESVCCFRLRRWILQPVSVVLQLASGGLVAGAQYSIEKYPSQASTLNAIGLGAGIAALVVNMLLLKVDNKLEDMDNYIMQRRNSNE